jgi:CheY-like chemotaxis protein/anti-sigma regulatory factor (Ser/Thr protein kinase)
MQQPTSADDQQGTPCSTQRAALPPPLPSGSIAELRDGAALRDPVEPALGGVARDPLDVVADHMIVGPVGRDAALLRTVVVDDDPDARLLLTRALDGSGRARVVGLASDGDEAVRVAEQHRPDLVLLDLNLPTVDGLTALPSVQQVCAPAALVVVISALPTDAAVSRAAEHGAPCLPKGDSYARLVTTVLQLVEDRRSPNGHVRWELPADLTSGALARRQLRRQLVSWGLSHLVDEAELLMSELVNNAVVHAGSGVVVGVRRDEQSLHIAVTDVGGGAPHRPTPDLDDTSGRGLMLVEAISTVWGTATDGDAKTVWFELALNGSP